MNIRLTRLSVALALALCAAAAHAQRSPAGEPQFPVQKPQDPSPTGLSITRPDFNVSLYGLIDGTLSYTTHANANGDHLFDFASTPWFSGSRWGITGSRLLGASGIEAIFKLENEYLISTGELDTANNIFNRDAWVGFQGKGFGKLTFGRQNTLARDFAQNYGDPYGSASVRYDEGGWTNTNNFKQLIFYAGSVTGTRYDKGVVYKWIEGPLAVGVGYQFGSVAGDQTRNTTKAIGFGWNGGAINISGFYNDADRLGLKDKAWSVGGNFTTDIFRVNAGYFGYKAEQGARPERKDRAWTVSGKVSPPGPLDYEIGYQEIKVENAAVGAAGNIPNPFAAMPGGALIATGKKKTLYASTFYHFNRFVEVYLAADYMKLSDGYHVAVANGFANQAEVGVGVRLRF